MAGLIPFPFEQPGVAGLNKEGRNTVLGPEWATKASDLVIDDEGRLATRKGTRAIAATDLPADVQVVWTMVSNAGAVQTYCTTSAGIVYELVSGTWTSVFTGLADGNVQFAAVNGIAYFVHSGTSLVHRQATSGGSFATVAGSPSGKACLSMYGRLWVIDDTTVKTHSTVLDPTSGYLTAVELTFAWEKGNDVSVALAEFNGALVIFGKNNTVIYANPEDPFDTATGTADWGNMFQKVESISGVGCLHRDTVQNVGKDLLYLSNKGMRTLSRVVQEKSNPVTDAAPQVRDYILDQVIAATDVRVKSAFSPKLGLYILTMADTTLVLDARRPLANGALRATEWDSAMNAPAYDNANGLLMARGEAVVRYSGVKDDVTSAGTGGTTLVGDFESGWIDFGNIVDGAAPLTKYLKKLHMTFVGGNGATIQYKWAVDYGTTFKTASATIPTPTTAATYGVSQYGIGKYGEAVSIISKTKNASRSGRVVKVGFKVLNSVSAFSVNRMDLFAKIGKMST